MNRKVEVFFYGASENSISENKQIIEENSIFEWVGGSSNPEETIKKFTFLNPDILIIDIEDVSSIETAAQIIRTIKSTGAKPHIVLLIKKGMTYNMKKLMLEGANDFVYSPLNQQTLSAIYETFQNSKAKIESFVMNRKDISKTKVISFFSPKGGVGKTFLALNVAAGLANFLNSKVLYLDLSFPYSDVPIVLDISPNHKNLYDLMIFLEENPNKNPNEYIVEIEDLGFSLILPPRSLIETSYIISHIHELKQTIQILRTYFDWTVIDLPPRYYDVFSVIFDITNENFGIITSEGESAVLLQQFKEEMMAQGIPLNMKVILNRKNPKIHKIIGNEWRALVPEGIFAEVEDDPLEAGIANNIGELVIARNTKSKLKKDIIKLIKMISEI